MRHLIATVLVVGLLVPGCARADSTAVSDAPGHVQSVDSISGSHFTTEPVIAPKPLVVPWGRQVQHLASDGGQKVPYASKAKVEVHLVSMNTKSLKYHEPDCQYYGCKNCVEVPLDEALAAGAVPCKKCH